MTVTIPHGGRVCLWKHTTPKPGQGVSTLQGKTLFMVERVHSDGTSRALARQVHLA